MCDIFVWCVCLCEYVVYMSVYVVYVRYICVCTCIMHMCAVHIPMSVSGGREKM